MVAVASPARSGIASRVQGLDWPGARIDLDAQGFAHLGRLLSARECAGLASLYADDARFRSHRHTLGIILRDAT